MYVCMYVCMLGPIPTVYCLDNAFITNSLIAFSVGNQPQLNVTAHLKM